MPEPGSMERDISRVEIQISVLTSQTREWHTSMTKELAELKTLVGQHGVLCPYRERIAAIAVVERDITDDRKEITDIKEIVHDLELAVARSSAIGGATGGSVVVIATGIVFGVGKAAGWW